MRQLLPTPADGLTDDDLLAAYAVPDGPGPHLRANFVASADGAVSLDGVSGGLSSPADKRVFGLLRDLADVVLVGAGTVRTEGYGYPAFSARRQARRRALGLAELPTFAVVTGSLDLDPSSELLAGAPVRTLLVTTTAAPADRRAALDPVAEVLEAGEDTVDLRAAVEALAARGLRRVLCEGGPLLLGGLAAAGGLDELCLTVAPLLAGAGPGRITAGPDHQALRLGLRHVLAEDDMLFLRYAVDRAG
ncbi:MAG TPA: pyrimidine reductase family protein [Mycobacteriales bacterium]|nr:pyrimidine reductase family protein [Mycobacteriales bacterium]